MISICVLLSLLILQFPFLIPNPISTAMDMLDQLPVRFQLPMDIFKNAKWAMLSTKINVHGL